MVFGPARRGEPPLVLLCRAVSQLERLPPPIRLLENEVWRVLPLWGFLRVTGRDRIGDPLRRRNAGNAACRSVPDDPGPSFMPRWNPLVEPVEGLQQVVAILEVDRLTWSEEDFIDLVGPDSIHREEDTIPYPGTRQVALRTTTHPPPDLSHVRWKSRPSAPNPPRSGGI